MNQYICEDGNTRSLKKFATIAVKNLEADPTLEEVVQQASHITELANDSMTRPDTLYPLPDGYQYYFSGFYGQVIGVGRPNLIH